jgi:Ca2+-transporting ATPase
VKVIRGGRYESIPKRDVVVGDIVLVETGEEVPCDGEVLDAVALLVDESKLTGEAVPVGKSPADRPEETPGKEHAYPPNRLYRSTIVADGHGTIRALAVGDLTEIGKTARAASEQDEEQTPLNEQLDRLSKIIGIVGLVIAGLTFGALLLKGALTGQLSLERGQWYFTGVLFAAILIALVRVWAKILYEGAGALGWAGDTPEYLDNDSARRWGVAVGAGALAFAAGVALGYAAGWMPQNTADWLPPSEAQAMLSYFMIAVVIIVVAVPEGLAMSVTLSLAYSMRKMTAQNTLVRKMHACETIGAATVICSDKTGTLTMNQMRVAEMRVPALGESGKPGGPPGSAASLVADAFAVNSTAQLTMDDGVLRSLGNPTEGALLVWLEGQGVDYLAARSAFRVADQLPFSTERKYMATVGTNTAGTGVLHVKGAP